MPAEDPRRNELTAAIIGAAMEVHRAIGPGLLESAYQACLVQELADRGIWLETQTPVPVIYKNVVLGVG